MATSRYKTKVTPGAVADKLRRLHPAIEEQAQEVVDEAVKVGLRVASENCPAPQIMFSAKQYESDKAGNYGHAVSIIAKGPKVHHAASRFSGTYSFPLVKLLEYGTGYYGEHDTVDNGTAHGYKPNMSGKGGHGWFYKDRKTGGSVVTHGIYPRHFMHKGAEAMRREINLSTRKRLFVAQLKKRSGL